MFLISAAPPLVELRQSCRDLRPARRIGLVVLVVLDVCAFTPRTHEVVDVAVHLGHECERSVVGGGERILQTADARPRHDLGDKIIFPDPSHPQQLVYRRRFEPARPMSVWPKLWYETAVKTRVARSSGMKHPALVVLDSYVKRHGGKAYSSPIDVVFSQTDAVQPDVIYLAADRLSLVGAKYIQGAPSLIVEVLSPSSSDVDPGRKLETHAQHGVPEYWIVDPATRTAVAHAKPSGKRYLQSVASVDGALAALTLPDLRFSIAENTEE